MLKIGHRGAPGNPRFGENTIRSFKKALWSGANAIEFDIRRSKDGQIVVIHDATVDRTTNGRGKVSEMNYSDIKRLDAGFGDYIPLLNEVFKKFSKTYLMFNVELKEEGLVGDILHSVLSLGLEERVVLSAFDRDDNDEDASSSWNDLVTSKIDLSGINTSIPIALLATLEKIKRMGGEKKFIAEAVKCGASAINPEMEAVTKTLMTSARTAGLSVNVWTVNNILQIKMLKEEYGVTGIISDFPELL